MRDWIEKIRAASMEELKRIQREWSEKGGEYNPQEWPVVLYAIADRSMELQGVDPHGAAF